MRHLLLNPEDSNRLSACYKAAVTRSLELLIATAFLTEWPIKANLNKGCKSILVLVGTDFGLTRKKALTDLLNWVPSEKKNNILAVPAYSQGSFHPKIIAWKEKSGKYFTLLGSSNLTNAAFKSNYEANIVQEISQKDFAEIRSWLRKIADNSQVISTDWIKKYKESKREEMGSFRGNRQQNVRKVIDLKIRVLKKYQANIQKRKEQQISFKEIKNSLVDIVEKCGNGKMRNREFWSEFWELWAGHNSRFQGSGIQFSGKKANWKQACASLLRIINGPKDTFDLDIIVQREIDYLKTKSNPVRGAWFTEMLCHFYPTKYPLLNQPVKDWLKLKNYSAQRGSTEGNKYIELAIKMRDAIKQNQEISTLAELDVVIWRIMDDLQQRSA